MVTTPDDRAQGLIAIRAWYDGSVKLSTLTEVVAYYDDQDPNFIGYLGQSVKTVSQPKVIAAMGQLARDNGPTLVPRSYFEGAIAGNSGLSAGDVVSAGAEGVVTFGKFLVGGLALYAAIGVGVLVFLNWPQIKRALHA